MNKILMAAAIVLVAGTPLAFAKTEPISNASLTTLHCSRVEQDFARDRAAYKSESAFQVAEEKALSLCRQDKDHDSKHAGSAHEGSGASTRS
jgi:hypothetical protein